MKGSFWGAWAVGLCLGIAELARPGFLALDQGAGWLSIAALVLPAALAGAAAGGLLARKSAESARLPYLLALLILLALPIAAQLRDGRGFATSPRSDRRVVILGVDGATWDQIDPLIEEGELPNFARLAREGAIGVLRSQEPTLSPRVWTTLASGVIPDRHGAKDFLSTQNDIRVPRIWEIASHEGGRIGVFGWLLTWPPGEPEGFLVPGWLARGSEAWPPQLEFFEALKGGGAERSGILALVFPAWQGYLNGLRLPTLLRAVRVKLWTKLAKPDDRTSTPKTLLLQSDMATDLFLHWMGRTEPEFSALVLYPVDTFAHQYWGNHDPQSLGLTEPPDEGRHTDVVESGYRQADDALGRILDRVDESTVVMVVSDHGTGPGRTAENNYSLRAEVLASALAPIAELRAFSITNQVVIRPVIEDDDAREEARVAVENKLRDVELDGVPLFEVKRSGPEFIAVSLRKDPDPSRQITILDNELELSELILQSDFTGGHTIHGIIGMWGADVEPGSRIDAELLDVAPTALALMGYPLSEEMNGTVLRQALTRNAAAALSVKTVPFYDMPGLRPPPSDEPEVEDEIRERLRALGYIQ